MPLAKAFSLLFHLFIFFSLLTVTLGVSSIQAGEISSEAKQPITLLVVGDSLSAGYGISQEKSWVNLLSEKLQQQQRPVEVINASISGNTSGNALNRLPPLLDQYQPEIVIIALGGNDGLRGFPLPTIEQNLSQLISLSQQQGATVMLLGIRIPPNYGFRYSDAFFALYQKLAQQHDTALIPFFMKDVGGVQELMQRDGIHPNEKAQPILLRNVWQGLAPLLSTKLSSVSQ